MKHRSMENVHKKNFYRSVPAGKLLLGIAFMVGLIAWGDNSRNLYYTIRSIKMDFVFALVIVGCCLEWVSCIKWNLFLKERGIYVSNSRLLKLYLIGRFFSNFMPSMIGGDLTRSYMLGRQINSQSQSFASIFMERLTGLIALITLAVFFSIINPRIIREPQIGIAIVIISLVFILTIGFLLNRKIMTWIGAKLGFIHFIKLFFQKIASFQIDIYYFKGKHKLLLLAMVFSFGFHFICSLNVYLSCLAINFYPSYIDIAVITPIILLLNFIPVSPNNIGWWEWTFSFLLVHAGAGTAEGLAVALLLRAMALLFSLAGGFFYISENADKKKDCVSVK